MRLWILLVSGLIVAAACSGSATPAAEPQTPPTTSAPRVTPAPARVELEVAVTNEATTRPPAADAELRVQGRGSWFPNLRAGGDVRGLGTFPVGEAHTFVVYPDGRDGIEIRVPFRMTAAMISGSDRDRVHVEIYDDRLLVWGTPLGEGTLEFDRDVPVETAPAPQAGYPADLIAAFTDAIRATGGTRASAACLLGEIAGTVPADDLRVWITEPPDGPVAAAVDAALVAALIACA